MKNGNGYLLDTNAIIQFLKGNAELVSVLADADFIAAVSVAVANISPNSEECGNIIGSLQTDLTGVFGFTAKVTGGISVQITCVSGNTRQNFIHNIELLGAGFGFVCFVIIPFVV